MNAVIYAVVTAFLVSQFGIGSKMASVLGYCAALPIAFVAHRSYAFGSRGVISSELRRFGITYLTGLLVSVLAMGMAVDYLGLHYSFGIVVGIALVPIVTFFVLDNWVFVDQVNSESDQR